MSVTINGDTGIDKITDGSVVADDLSSTLDLSSKTITLATDAVDQLSTASGSAPSYSARAWVNFNGQGTVAIRASANVSSITDNGTGLYRVNFTTAMPDANFAVSGFGQYDNAGSSNSPVVGLPRTATSQGTGYVDISTISPPSTQYDSIKVLVIVHR